MSAGRICIREVHLVQADESIEAAARRMAEERVGTLLVLDPEKRPRGVLTDRDVTVRCVAQGRDPVHTPVAAVMSKPVVCVSEATPIEEALSKMAMHRIRRLAVVGDNGALVGILALDDVLDLLIEETESIGRLLRRKG
jgi:CBS domain-containing protein